MIVSFDFDDTILNYTENKDGEKEPNGIDPVVRELIAKEREEGNDVIIVTARYGPQPAFGKDNDDLIAIANELGIEDVYFTNGEDKAETLLDLGVARHYDNDQAELDAIEKRVPHCTGIGKPFDKTTPKKTSKKFIVKIKKRRLGEASDYQKEIKKDYVSRRNKYVSTGKVPAGAPYTKKPNKTRSKSAPPGFGGT